MSDPLSITAGVAGILSLTIEVSRLLREQINTYQGALKDAQEILDQVDRIAQVLQGLERLIMNDAIKIYFYVDLCSGFSR
jgi:transcriptional regulatory protein LevR